MAYIESGVHGDYQRVWFERYEDHFLVRKGCLDTLQRLMEEVGSNGGELISRLWDGVATRVTLNCCEGHVWHTLARKVLYEDAWCRTCAFDGQWKGHEPDRRRRSFKQLLEFAQEAGVEHKGSAKNLREATRWRCEKDHTWVEPGRAILIRGFFCQRCDGRRAKLYTKAQKTAEERGGVCLSTEYINNRTPMHWRCKMGHEWSAPYKRVVTNGSWCLECANIARRKPLTRSFVCWSGEL
jgi:hypothetical protein